MWKMFAIHLLKSICDSRIPLESESIQIYKVMIKMKKILIALLGAVICFGACSRNGQSKYEPLQPDLTVLLYPQGQAVDAGIVEEGRQITLGPGDDNGLRGPEVLNVNGNIANIGDSARMVIYFPKNPNGLLIVNCPGGGYQIVSSINEGMCAAEWLTSQGVTVCSVNYRLPNVHHTVPLTDVQNAFRYCRAHAKVWGIEKIGVMGYSAGGHLAASASTLYVDELTRPDFSILIYPVIDLSDLDITHHGTRSGLLGDHPSRELLKHYSLQNRVTENTPETFLALSAYDDIVPPINSFLYFRALQDHNVPCQMHVYPLGGHGWGFYHEPYSPDKLKQYREVFYTDLGRFLKDLCSSPSSPVER